MANSLSNSGGRGSGTSAAGVEPPGAVAAAVASGEAPSGAATVAAPTTSAGPGAAASAGGDAAAAAAQPDSDEQAEPYDDPGQQVEPAGPCFVSALADVLAHLSSLPGRAQRTTRFHSVRAPQLSIRDYLMRISKFFQCSRECFVLCLVYIDRIVKLHPDFTICSLNIHRLLVTSVLLAVKFFDDVYYSNAYYARVGGVQTKEVNKLEALFLELIEWRLHVSPQEYDQYRNHVCRAASGRSAAVAAPSVGPPEPSAVSPEGGTTGDVRPGAAGYPARGGAGGAASAGPPLAAPPRAPLAAAVAAPVPVRQLALAERPAADWPPASLNYRVGADAAADAEMIVA